MNAPELSVAVVIGSRRARVNRLLRSLLDQKALSQLEVILVDYTPVRNLDHRDHSAVRVIPVQEDTHYGAARALGVRNSQAPVVAFLEDHCTALPGWAATLIQAHRKPWAGVGGEVHNGNPGAGSSDARYFSSYGRFSPPLKGGETAVVAGQNSSYKREILLSFGSRLDSLLLADLALQKALTSLGHRLFLEPAAKIAHYNETELRTAYWGDYYYHRAYGAVRSEQDQWPLSKRLAQAGLSAGRPLYRMAKMYSFARRNGKTGVYRQSMRALLFASVWASVGFAKGVLQGMGNADRRFTEYELSVPRGTESDE